MFGYKVVSRKDLFDDSIDTEPVEPPNTENCCVDTYKPPNDLEIVEINIQKHQEGEGGKGNHEADEYEFPLFSFGPRNAQTEGSNSSQGPLIRVSLREPSPDILTQKRPRDYYFREYSEKDHEQFKKSAIDYSQLLRDAKSGANVGWPQFRGSVLSVKEHNDRLEGMALRERHRMKRRPGKNQRLARKAGAQNEKERAEKAKEIKKLIKKKFHKRGGKKNKNRSRISR
ncbi:YNL050C [Zygosaccharomyces parabailii]|uniref:ZYBA0S10-01640g1_1 n=1 Tax=Zygosaccharomyces bailii (strain CLIB 213 / ATCC 58445 / CBS 680 / BCRC 21525 / NBRC 1098 / NCYC 1416 / NRRL Y-2227) TaxID=1333698 RepID=A0A8J2T9V3_ZYGB2|nr:YNL050C [Zygosaccharomyces parabailii]CDF91187.1 ZYBA0S10-01640g1_1 [Zygosaccharomyces bailii CLIB 213]